MQICFWVWEGHYLTCSRHSADQLSSSFIHLRAHLTRTVQEFFDSIVFACSAEVVLKILKNPTW